MTDPEILELIVQDGALVALADRGDDESLARQLADKLPPVPSGTRLRAPDFLRLFGWMRGVEILAALSPAFVSLLTDGEGIDVSDAGAAPFWDAQMKAGILHAEEQAALLALGERRPALSADAVSRIVRPLRPEGKVVPLSPVATEVTLDAQ